jgi:hypothetical protein
MAVSDESIFDEVDFKLKQWRQGDFVLGEHWFVYRFDPNKPLTDDSENAEERTDLVEVEVVGFVVVTQTCDIVRNCSKRPFIEVVPLVAVDDPGDPEKLHRIKNGKHTQYAFVPGAAGRNLVADLDCVMTVEKAVVAGWNRECGCMNDEDIRALRQALARKRIRFAFPHDFNKFVGKLQDRLQKKHGKSSPEGDALRALREIRVSASPSWQDSTVGLMFWFIREDKDVTFKGEWTTHLKEWLALIPPSEKFSPVDGLVVTLADIRAQDYVESDPLDLDHLSG